MTKQEAIVKYLTGKRIYNYFILNAYWYNDNYLQLELRVGEQDQFHFVKKQRMMKRIVAICTNYFNYEMDWRRVETCTKEVLGNQPDMKARLYHVQYKHGRRLRRQPY